MGYFILLGASRVMMLGQERMRKDLYNKSYQKAGTFPLFSTKPREGEFREPSEEFNKCHQSLGTMGNTCYSYLKKSKGKV